MTHFHRFLTLATGLLLSAASVQAVDEATWGQVKNDQPYFQPPNDADIARFSFAVGTSAAAKVTDDDGERRRRSQFFLDKNRAKTKTIGRKGGVIRVGHKTFNHGDYTLRAEFKVPKGALDERVPISMTLVGNTLEDLVVEFAPAGLVFKKGAILTLKVGKRRAPANLDGMEVLHIHEDGTVERARWKYDVKELGFVIDMGVPGFSKYSSGGGW